MAKVNDGYSFHKGDEIEDIKEFLEGRRVLKVEQRIYPVEDPEDHNGYPMKADYPVLHLDDGSEVVILDGDGNPPIIEQEKPPHIDNPIVWEGD